MCRRRRYFHVKEKEIFHVQEKKDFHVKILLGSQACSQNRSCE